MGHRLGKEKALQEAVPTAPGPCALCRWLCWGQCEAGLCEDRQARLAVRAAPRVPLSSGGEGMTDEPPSWKASSE